MATMVTKESVAITQEINGNDDIDRQHPEDSPTEIAQEIVKFDGNEKYRFADRQPPGPAYAKNKPDTLDQREKAIKESPGRSPEHVRLRELPHARGEHGKELVSWMHFQPSHQARKLPRKIIIPARIDGDR